MTSQGQPHRLECAIRAHAWVYGDGDVIPGDVPEVAAVRETSMTDEETQKIVERMLPRPDAVYDPFTAKLLLAYVMVTCDMMEEFRPRKAFVEYTAVVSGVEVQRFDDVSAFVLCQLEEQAVGVVGPARWTEMCMELLHELYLL